MKNLSISAFVLSCFFLLSSCGNLKAINTFAAKSTVSVAQYEDLKYSFQHYCEFECHLAPIKAISLDAPVCKCDDFVLADSLTTVIYDRIKAYLIGIEKLSNKTATDIKYDDLEKNIATGNYGTMSVNAADVASYGKITKIVSDVFLGGYRKSKLKQYIKDANAPLQVLLKSLQTIIGANLYAEVELEKDAMADYYKKFIVLDGAMPKYAKGKAVEEYFEKLEKLNKTEAQLKLFAKSLQVIAVGHQQLYDNRNSLSAKELVAGLAENVGKIQTIYTEIKKLKD